MLITCVLHIRPEGHREPHSEVRSLGPAERLVGFQPGIFRFWSQRLNLLSHSPQSILISLLKLIRNISKYHFLGEGVLLNSIMDIYCSTAEGEADQNRMAVDVRGGAVRSFHFAEVINEWPLNGGIIETRVRIWSFWYAHCRYQSYLRLIIYKFQIHILLLVYKIYSFLFLFWIE